MILAGDIGGTKSNLAVFRCDGLTMKPVAQYSCLTADYSGLVPMVQTFLGHHSLTSQIRACCFGVAGPVVAEACETDHLPWKISVADLEAAFPFEIIRLLNDLEATAYGISTLEPGDFTTLNEGNPKQPGNAALIAAGTGLGEAILYWDGESYQPIASEGGQTDFAPRDYIEIRLLRYLLKKHKRVSYEQVLSGPGLLNIYSFLKKSGEFSEPEWLKQKLESANPAAAISDAALAHQSRLCAKALDLFASIYGAEAGNLALKVMAVSGVYVAGGIAPKIIDKLTDGGFMRAFHSNGQLSHLLETVPVRVIMNEKTPVYGAANYLRIVSRAS